MTAQHLDRIRRLADFLETVPDKKFNMLSYAANGFTEHRCGSTACALGYSTVIFPDFPVALEPIDEEYSDYSLRIKDWDDFYNSNLDTDAYIGRFFGVSNNEYDYIFCKSEDRRDVIRKLRNLLS
jgi:hypothetical protein